MPATLSYPGVYIEEVPSGVRTITGVATSITAFIGRAKRGPVNKATTITSYSDFERHFGGLWEHGALGFAVRDFYLNGGSTAVIARLFHTDPAATDPDTATFDSTTIGLTLSAANQGSWGGDLKVTVDTNVSAAAADDLGVATADLFNLTVADSNTGAVETHRNLTVKESRRRVDRVLKQDSALIRYAGTLDPTSPPTVAAGTVSAGDASDGLDLAQSDDFTPTNAQLNKKGLFALEQVDLFNMLVIPPYLAGGNVDTDLIDKAAKYCEQRRAMLIVDAPTAWNSVETAVTQFNSPATDPIKSRSRNAILYFPRLRQPNPLKDGAVETFAASGAVAGVIARTDSRRGVWKAPAGIDANLVGVAGFSVPLTDGENGRLNPLGVNCLRAFPAAGRVVWGSRTLRGDDRLASEWKYVPIRRLALFIEESLFRGTQWVVFEPNDEPLWSQIRLNVGAFMQSLFRQGAFQGSSPREAYFVKCDGETTTQTDRNLGVVNILVGFAPLKPAEFVVIKIQQMAGQTAA